MLLKEVNKDFPPIFEAVGCILISKNKSLLLKRRSDRPYPLRWGIPSGKLQEGENRTQGVIRELYEETGILLSKELLSFLGSYHIITDDMSFLYSLFYCNMNKVPKVTINFEEHVRAEWFSYNECHNLDLMPDLDSCFKEVSDCCFYKPK